MTVKKDIFMFYIVKRYIKNGLKLFFVSVLQNIYTNWKKILIKVRV